MPFFTKARPDKAVAGGPGAADAAAISGVEIAVKGESELLDAAQGARFEPWPFFHFRLLSAVQTQTPDFDELMSLAAARNVVPMEHQAQAVRQLLGRMQGRGMLCDEVGMGKTIEAGLAALELVMRGLAKRILVLAPPSLLGQWKDEMLSKFGLDFVTSEDKEFRGWDAHPRIIASLHTAKREPHAGRVAEVSHDLLIVDEAHHARNARTLSFELIRRLRPRYLFLLSATPVQNSLEDLFSLVSLVRPGQLDTYRGFRRRFVQRGEPLLPRDADTLRQLLRDVMIRNRRATSGVRFTRRYASTVRLQMSDAERRLYEEATALVRTLYRRGNSVSRTFLRTVQQELGSSPAAAWPTIQRLGSDAQQLLRRREEMPVTRKFERLIELAREFGDKMIVFTRFHATHEELVRRLKEAGFETASIHGGMRFREKEENLARFERSGRLLVCTDAGSEGRNLQFCNAIVNFDLPWNPMKIEQRIGRVSRIGQEREVYVFNLVAEGTLEDRLLDLLHAKINMFELVIGEVDAIIGHLEEDRGFEEIIMDMWCAEEEEGGEPFGRSMERLANDLVEAKRRYLKTRQDEDAIFADALSTGGSRNV